MVLDTLRARVRSISCRHPEDDTAPEFYDPLGRYIVGEDTENDISFRFLV
jgi:hypothetical protein